MGASVRPTEDPALRLQYYRETGQHGEAARYEQYLKETGQHLPSTPGQQFGTLVAQGASGGFAGKILGGIDAVNHIAPKWMGGDAAPASEFGSRYRETRDRILRAEDEGIEAHPIAGRVVEGVAGLGASLPLAAASGAVRAGSLGRRMLLGAGAGAAAGALTGAGHATGDVGDYAREMGTGAAMGAVAGSALPALAEGAGRLGGKVVTRLRLRPSGKTAEELAADAALLREPTGAEANTANPLQAAASPQGARPGAGDATTPTGGERVRARFGAGAERAGIESVRTGALRKVATAFEQDNVLPENAIAYVEANPSKPIAALDMGSGNVAGLARAAKDTPGLGRKLVPEFLHGRSSGATNTEGETLKRVIADVEQRIGLAPENYYASLEQMTGDMKKAASKNYGAIRNTVVDDPEVLALFDEPEFQAIHQRLRDNARLGGKDRIAPLSTTEDIGGEKIRTLNQQTLGTLDKVKRQLDKIVAGKAEAVGTVDRDLAYNMRDRVHAILDRMDDVHPQYGEARSQYRGSAEAIDAYERGKAEFMKLDPRAMRQTLEQLPERVRDLYRRGGYDALRSRLSKIEDGGNIGSFLEKNPDIRDRVSVLAKTPDDAAALAGDIHVERRLGDRKAAILGGPNSAERLIEYQHHTAPPKVTQVGNAVRNVPVIGKPLGWAIDNSLTRGELDHTSEMMGEVGRLMTTRGPEEVKALMDAFERLKAADNAKQLMRYGAGGGASGESAATDTRPRRR